MAGCPINEDRASAVALGLMFYEGRPHKNCGHTLRYASGGGCVHCARLISTEQREARKYLKHLAARPVDIKPELGEEAQNGLEADDPVAREQAGIDELM